MIAHDVHHEIGAARRLEPQLDRAAVLMVYAQPERRPGNVVRYNPSGACPAPVESNSFELRNELRRMEATPKRANRAYGLRVAQFIGEPAGRFSARGALYSTKPGWKNGAGANTIPFDAQHSWWAAFSECLFEFSPHWIFGGYASGETYPLLVDGRTVLLVDAVGTLTGISERARSLTGVFSMNGRLTADGGFYGVMCCRIPDPTGLVLRDREIPALGAQSDPSPETTLLVVRASGWTESIASDTGKPHVQLAGTAEIRSAAYAFTPHGHPGLRAAVLLGAPLGMLKVDVAAYLNTCGKVDGPAEFSANYDYRFLDEDGDEVASVGARAVDGLMFDFAIAGASQTRTIAYAGTGPVVSGAGHLCGASGQFSVLGTRSAAPAAFAETGLINLSDPEGRLRAAGREREPMDVSAPSPLQRFLPMVAKLDEYAEKHREWRWAVRKRSEMIANTIAAKYNELRNVGDFEGIPIDPALLRAQFEAKIAPFNPVVFERYGGPARGQFRFYSHATRQETGGNVLYSYWNPATFRFGARYCKFITGSFQRYVRPDQVPDFSTHQFDPIVNSYRDDVGVVSYILVFQGKAPGLYQERTSFAYKMPGPHEVMWFVKDLKIDGQPAPPDVFMSSHEWKEVQGNQTRYLLVGMFWKIDFDRGSIELADDMFWRALYEEEHGYA